MIFFSYLSVLYETHVCLLWDFIHFSLTNKANGRDLIAATGLVISLKLDSNYRFFSVCDLEIYWMTSKNSRAPLLYYIYLCGSSQIHRQIQTYVTIRKRSIRSKSVIFFVPCKLEIWRMTMKNDRAPLLCYFKLSASFRSHWCIQTEATVRKRSIWVKIDGFLALWPWNLTDNIAK